MGCAVVDVADITDVGGTFKPVRHHLRRPTAGSAGMSFLVIGGVPSGIYLPWTPPDE